MAIRPEQKGQPIFPRVLVTSVVAAAILISIIIVGTVVASRAAPLDIYSPPEELLPGHPLPRSARCNWPPSAEEIVHCHVLLEHDIYLVYDTIRGVITSTSVSVDNKANVGRLMLAWGTPSGVRRYPWSIRMQWGTRYIYVSTQPFRPASVPYFIHYSLEADSAGAWEGFSSRG